MEGQTKIIWYICGGLIAKIRNLSSFSSLTCQLEIIVVVFEEVNDKIKERIRDIYQVTRYIFDLKHIRSPNMESLRGQAETKGTLLFLFPFDLDLVVFAYQLKLIHPNFRNFLI